MTSHSVTSTTDHMSCPYGWWWPIEMCEVTETVTRFAAILVITIPYEELRVTMDAAHDLPITITIIITSRNPPLSPYMTV